MCSAIMPHPPLEGVHLSGSIPERAEMSRGQHRKHLASRGSYDQYSALTTFWKSTRLGIDRVIWQKRGQPGRFIKFLSHLIGFLAKSLLWMLSSWRTSHWKDMGGDKSHLWTE
eukprot:g9533.t1